MVSIIPQFEWLKERDVIKSANNFVFVRCFSFTILKIESINASLSIFTFNNMGCRFLIWEVPWELFLVNNKVNYYTYTLHHLPFSIKLEWNSNRMILIRKESKFGDSNHNILRLNYCKCKSPLCWSSVQEHFSKFGLKKGGKRY